MYALAQEKKVKGENEKNVLDIDKKEAERERGQRGGQKTGCKREGAPGGDLREWSREREGADEEIGMEDGVEKRGRETGRDTERWGTPVGHIEREGAEKEIGREDGVAKRWREAEKERGRENANKAREK
jgi:hypothetical protein